MSGTCGMTGCNNLPAVDSQFCARCLMGDFPKSSTFHDIGGHPDAITASRAEGFFKRCEYSVICQRLVPRTDKYCSMCLAGHTPAAVVAVPAPIWGSGLGLGLTMGARCRYSLCGDAAITNSTYCADHTGTAGDLTIPPSRCAFPGCGQAPASGYNYCDDCQNRRYPGNAGRNDGGASSAAASSSTYGAETMTWCATPLCTNTRLGSYSYCKACLEVSGPTSKGSKRSDPVCEECQARPRTPGSTKCSGCRLASIERFEARFGGGSVKARARCKMCKLLPRMDGYDECEECREHFSRTGAISGGPNSPPL